MYTKILNPSFTVFDGTTGNYIGHSHVTLTPDSERKVLNLLNYNQIPDTLSMTDVTLSRPSENYVPPQTNQTLPRSAIMEVEAFDQSTGARIPFEIRIEYDILARGNLLGDQYHFDSVEMRNIRLIDRRRLQF